MEYMFVNNELYHHGIKGQRWGIRRWQNEDGTFNEAGKKRYFNSSGSLRGNAHRALAKVYDINDKFYSKNGRNKTLASMNAAARTTQLKKAELADKAYANKLRDKAIAKANKKQETDEWKAKSREEKLAAQNYQKYGKGNLPGQGIARHYVNNAKYWKQSMSDIKQTSGAMNKAKKYVNAILDQPMTLSGFTGTSETTLRKRLKGQSYEWY